jgi:hypothetical protein
MSTLGDTVARAADIDCTRSEIEEQLRSILSSTHFRNSVVLRSFLRFITEQTLVSGGSNLNEYLIATQVFSRGATFDSAEDTIVRTQAYRLRLKLNEYYNTDGIRDSIIIEVPKGHYVPSFRRRQPPPYELPFTSPAEPDERPPGKVLEKSGLLRIVGIALSALILFGLGVFIGSKEPKILPTAEKTNAVDAFWTSFLGSEREPIVAYTNTLYLAAASGELIPFPGGPVADRGAMVSLAGGLALANHSLFRSLGPLYFEDDTTGVGEVIGAVAVSKALERLGAHPSFKRSRLLTTYDLQNHNVIFLGSPFVNQILNELPGSPNFVFKPASSGPMLWRSSIQNKRPKPGEMTNYLVERDPSQVILADYAVISLLPGLAPGKGILVLAGLTTSGTEGSADFATSVRGIAEMAERLPGRGTSQARVWPSSFEYLLKVHLSHGVDIIQSDCLASRTTP